MQNQKILQLFLIIGTLFYNTPLFAVASSGVLAEDDILTVCNNCSDFQKENLALQVTKNNKKIHILDFSTGTVSSFLIQQEFEPGSIMTISVPILSPADVIVATYEINSLINTALNRGGNFDRTTNILTDTIILDPAIASTSLDILADEARNQQVAQQLREIFLASIFSQFGRAWERAILNIVFQVTVIFPDGSTATYVLGNIFSSFDPFILIYDSITDKNGNKISTVNAQFWNGGSDGSAQYADVGVATFNDGGFGYYTQCANYTITFAGEVFEGTNCWYVAP